MKIEKDKVVEIHYTLRAADGEEIDSTEGEPPLPYLHGAGEIVPGLEKALTGKQVGDTLTLTLTPDQAYGDYDETLVDEIPLDAFPEDVEIAEGDEIVFLSEEGEEVPGVIEHINDEGIIVNYNHPLAGETVTFDVTVADIRDATAEELEHGHAHDRYAEDDEWEDDEWEELWDDEEDWDDDDD